MSVLAATPPATFTIDTQAPTSNTPITLHINCEFASTDEQNEAFSRLPHVTNLIIENNVFTKKLINSLRGKLSSVTSISFINCSEVSKKAIEVLLSEVPNLQGICFTNSRSRPHVSPSPHVTHDTLALLQPYHNLQKLDLTFQHRSVTDDTLQMIITNHPNLAELSLQQCHLVTDEGARLLVALKGRLKKLNMICAAKISTACLDYLRQHLAPECQILTDLPANAEIYCDN